jgi:predicted DNA-binding WGR domain protein
MSAIQRFLQDVSYDDERPIGEVLAQLKKLVHEEPDDDDQDDDDAPSPLAAALLLRRPMGERARVLDLLAKGDRLGGTYLEALPVVARTLRPDWLAQAMDLAAVKGGPTFGPAKRSLLHEVCDSIGENDWTDERYDEAGDSENVFDTSSSVNWLVSEQAVDERVLPTIALLLERGDRADAVDKRGKTPLDLARRGRKELRAQDWKRVEAALGEKSAPVAKASPASSEGQTLEDYFHDPAFALGVLDALRRDGVVKKATLSQALDALDDDDESAREASAVQALHRTKVTKNQLATIETLSFDPDEPIYLWLAEAIGVDLGGESEALTVGSLDGIHHLTGLVSLDLRHGYASGAKLDPVLEHLDQLPRLRRLGVAPKAVSKALMRKLTERGLEIGDPPPKEAARKATKAAVKAANPKKTPAEKTPAKTTAAKKGARRFELVEGTSSKFWEIELGARKVLTRYGRIGSVGQTTEKSFATSEEAQREHDRLIAEKTKKGYSEA